MEKLFAVIDAGTQNVKAFVINEKGAVLTKAIFPTVPYFSSEVDFAEQDALSYLTLVKKAMKAAVKDIPKDKIIGVAITTHRSTIIPVDKNGVPVRPAITWLDERKTEGLKLPGGVTGLIIKLLGQGYTLNEYQRRSKFNWMRVNEPENYKKTYKFLTTSSYIFHALTGDFKDSYSMIVGLFPIDLKGLRWHPNRIIYDVFGVKRRKLPALVSPAEVAGVVSEKGAEEFGLRAGLPVIIGAGDKQSELLASGGVSSDILEISYGTAAVAEVLSDRFVEHARRYFFTWGSAIPNKWVLEAFVGRGYWMLSWFSREFARHKVEEAKKRGVSAEDLLDKELSDVPPGSDGLMLQPYWAPFAFDPSSKGAIIGFSGIHTRAHIYRAIIEGIAFELRRVLEIIKQYSGLSPKEIRIGGGGSRCDEILRITADIFNLPVRRIHTEFLSALGAAIDAAVALKVYPDFESAVTAMSHPREVFYPNQENVRVYNALYNDVYKEIYPSLKKLYHKIDNIVKFKKLS
jgi:sugar (pentulose or hexulose) kinase